MREQKNLVVLVTVAAYFAATFLGQKMKLRILTEKLLVISGYGCADSLATTGP